MDQDMIPHADKLLEEYLALRELLKPMVLRIEEIRAWCKSKGPFCTERFVCSVETRKRTAMVSMEEAIAILTKEIVESLKLTKTSEFKLVHVSKRDQDLTKKEEQAIL